MEEGVAPRRGRFGLTLLAAVLVAGGAIAGSVLLGGSGRPAQAAQLASIRLGCERWLDTDPHQPGDTAWCDDMTGFMAQHMAGGSTTPAAMWGDPDRMLATCEQWMRTGPPGTGATTASWCEAMVRWMTAHVGSWNGQGGGGWMRGPMMGGP